jgi:hypothetical protein
MAFSSRPTCLGYSSRGDVWCCFAQCGFRSSVLSTATSSAILQDRRQAKIRLSAKVKGKEEAEALPRISDATPRAEGLRYPETG